MPTSSRLPAITMATRSISSLSARCTSSKTLIRNCLISVYRVPLPAARPALHPRQLQFHSAVPRLSSESREDVPSAPPPPKNEEVIPWFLRVETPRPPTHPFAERQQLPELPDDPPPVLEDLVKELFDVHGITDLAIYDLRALNPPAALGADTIMVVGTARSERHLHSVADKVCRWMRSEHGWAPVADGLLGRNELKLRNRRKRRRGKLVATEEGVVDEGKAEWVCVNAQREGLFVQLFTDGKREVMDLDKLWGDAVARAARHTEAKKRRARERAEVVGSVEKEMEREEAIAEEAREEGVVEVEPRLEVLPEEVVMERDLPTEVPGDEVLEPAVARRHGIEQEMEREARIAKEALAAGGEEVDGERNPMMEVLPEEVVMEHDVQTEIPGAEVPEEPTVSAESLQRRALPESGEEKEMPHASGPLTQRREFHSSRRRTNIPSPFGEELESTDPPPSAFPPADIQQNQEREKAPKQSLPPRPLLQTLGKEPPPDVPRPLIRHVDFVVDNGLEEHLYWLQTQEDPASHIGFGPDDTASTPFLQSFYGQLNGSPLDSQPIYIARFLSICNLINGTNYPLTSFLNYTRMLQMRGINPRLEFFYLCARHIATSAQMPSDERILNVIYITDMMEGMAPKRNKGLILANAPEFRYVIFLASMPANLPELRTLVLDPPDSLEDAPALSSFAIDPNRLKKYADPLKGRGTDLADQSSIQQALNYTVKEHWLDYMICWGAVASAPAAAWREVWQIWNRLGGGGIRRDVDFYRALHGVVLLGQHEKTALQCLRFAGLQQMADNGARLRAGHAKVLRRVLEIAERSRADRGLDETRVVLDKAILRGW